MLHFIVNPHSGGNKVNNAKEKLERVKSFLDERKVPYKIHITQYKWHAKEITESITLKGNAEIIAMGGDGTLHEILNGFKDFDTCSLGIIPSGTGNDFATGIGLTESVEDCLNIILKNQPKYTDFLQLPSVRCINVAGMGLDVEVLKRYERLKKKTKAAYGRCLLKTLLTYKCKEFKIKINQKIEKFRSYIVAVANGIMFGGGLKVCPAACQYDGQFNLVNIKSMNKFRLIKALLMLKKGTILNHPNVNHLTSDEIVVETNNPEVINCDGELYSGVPFEVKLIKNKLKFFRP